MQSEIQFPISCDELIQDQKLSTRAKVCCRTAGINTIGDLLDYAEHSSLYLLRSCGRKTIEELTQLIETAKNSPDISMQHVHYRLSNSIRGDITIFFNTALAKASKDDAAYFKAIYKNAEQFLTAMKETPEELFRIDDSVPPERVIAFWNIEMQILKTISNYYIASPHTKVTLEYFANFYQKSLPQLEVKSHDLLLSKFCETRLNMLKAHFDEIKRSLSTRSINVLNKNKINYQNIIRFLQDIQSRVTIKNCGLRSRTEIALAYSKFFDFTRQLSQLDENVVQFTNTHNSFPFLHKSEVNQVIRLKTENGKLPIFYICFKYLQRSQRTTDIIYNNKFGIFSEPRKFETLARKFNLTRERIRQIFTSHTFPEQLNEVLPHFNKSNYSFINDPIIDILDCHKEVMEREFQNDTKHFTPNAFAGLYNMFRTSKALNYEGVKFFVDAQLVENFDYKGMFAEVAHEATSKVTATYAIPLRDLVLRFKHDDCHDIEATENIIALILDKTLGLKVNESRDVLIPKNVFDLEGEIVKIIEEYGRPIHFNDLYELFQAKFPYLKQRTASSIRTTLYSFKQLKFIGKTSTITLTKWDYSPLTIRGLIHEALKASDKPLTLDEIMVHIEANDRKTSRNSVHSTIWSDSNYGFIKFAGGYFGLESKQYGPEYKQIDWESLSRKSFIVRLNDFLQFVDKHHHVPFASSDEHEVSLNRWYRNVYTGNIETTPEQRAVLDAEMAKRQQYVMTSSDFTFIRKCQTLKAYVKHHRALPKAKVDPVMRQWLSKSRRTTDQFSEKKAVAWDDLCKFLRTYGIKI